MLYIVTGKRGSGKTGFLAWQASHDADRERVVISNIKTSDPRVAYSTDLPSFTEVWEIRDAGRTLTVIIDDGDWQLEVWRKEGNAVAKWLDETLAWFSQRKAGSCDIYVSSQNPHLLPFADIVSLRFHTLLEPQSLRVQVQQSPDWHPHHEFTLDWWSVRELIKASETVTDKISETVMDIESLPEPLP